MGWGCRSVGRALDGLAAGAGLSPRYSKGFFFRSQLPLQTLLCVSVPPPFSLPSRAIAYMNISAGVKDPVDHVSSVDYRNAETPSMLCRLGSATLSPLAFLGESNPNFLWEKSHWDKTVRAQPQVYVADLLAACAWHCSFNVTLIFYLHVAGANEICCKKKKSEIELTASVLKKDPKHTRG